MDDRHDAILEQDTMGHPTLTAMDDELPTNKSSEAVSCLVCYLVGLSPEQLISGS